MAKTNGSIVRQIAFTKDVTPSDTVDLVGGVTRALLVGADGDVAVMYANGETDTLPLMAGLVYPICVKRVLATGTDSITIKACY